MNTSGQFESTGLLNLKRKKSNGVFYLHAKIGGTLFRETLETTDVEEAQKRRDARVEQIQSAQASGETGRDKPPLPREIQNIEDIQRLLEWVNTQNAKHALPNKFEAEKLFTLIPRAKAVLKKIDTTLFAGGVKLLARGDSDLLEKFIQERSR